MAQNEAIIPPRLKSGDTIRLVSPASTPTHEYVSKLKAILEELGLIVEVGKHALDEYGYMAGKDEDRLADLNDAFRDPNVKAVIATRRLAHLNVPVLGGLPIGHGKHPVAVPLGTMASIDSATQTLTV